MRGSGGGWWGGGGGSNSEGWVASAVTKNSLCGCVRSVRHGRDVQLSGGNAVRWQQHVHGHSVILLRVGRFDVAAAAAAITPPSHPSNAPPPLFLVLLLSRML